MTLSSKAGFTKRCLYPVILLSTILMLVSPMVASRQAMAQLPIAPAPAQPTPASDIAKDDEQVAPSKVEVEPVSTDVAIADRLERILTATNWFENPKANVEEGVVFLSGVAKEEIRKKWAGDLARNTRDVVAVVNRMTIKAPALLDFSPAWLSLRELWGSFVQMLPVLLFGLFVTVLAWYAGRGVTALIRHSLTGRNSLNKLLREVIARVVGFGIFLLGLYLVLIIIGLARLAVTVLGGTGLIGLIIGIAFRDITENFLASIFLSIQRPFRTGDLIKVDDITGYVQRLTVRTTVLMSLDGTVVQIPNSTVYKSSLFNYTSNPNRRESFVIGIGYEDRVPQAQGLAMDVLTNHPAVLKEPEPWVLVDNLGQSTVDLKIYFWLDGTKHSWLKVRSSVIRLVKRTFQEHGISLPDELREVLITREVPISLRLGDGTVAALTAAMDGEYVETSPGKNSPATHPAGDLATSRTEAISQQAHYETEAVSTAAEGNLTSEAETVEAQAKSADIPDKGDDLLK